LESELRQVFSDSHSGGPINGNHWEFGKRLINGLITICWNGEKKSEPTLVGLNLPLEETVKNEFGGKLAKTVRNPFLNKKFKKIQAERDIKPEASAENRDLLYNGSGATNNIDLFINDSAYPRELVSETLLNDLNTIVEPDMHFEEITVRRIESSGTWEIFYKERVKGYVSLSKSGSGLKTILLVLINILLIPVKEKCTFG
jgi:hypothetical protein